MAKSKSHENIQELTADVARELANNLRKDREESQVKEVLSYLEDVIRS